jgi:hypothetical protein
MLQEIFSGLLAGLLLAGSAAAQEDCRPRHRALILGIDGARGDVLHDLVWRRAQAPALQALMSRGRWARCPDAGSREYARAHPGPRHAAGPTWVTAPGWASVLSGVDSSRHGVDDNSAASLAAWTRSAPQFPSFLLRARQAGLATAAGGVGAFLSSSDAAGVYPGVLDYECADAARDPQATARWAESCNLTQRLALDSRDPQRDEKLVAWLLEQIDGHAAVVMGVLDQVDEAGHRSGFGWSSRYREALRAADAQVGRLVAELDRGVDERCEAWLVIVTSDHGGHRRLLFGGSHERRAGPDDAIPFAVALLGAPHAAPLVEPVTQMDVNPTVLSWLGLEPAPGLDGREQGIKPGAASGPLADRAR